MTTLGRRAQRILQAAALAAALGVAGCGGGIYLGFGDGFGDDPPAVSLAGPTGAVRAGTAITLLAAASDDHGVDMVQFYRIDSSGPRRIGDDLHAPYELVITVPDDGRTALEVFARAWDFDGNSADSAVLRMAIVP